MPQSSVVPTIGAQLVNKTYVDGLPPAPTPNLSAVLTAGSSAGGTSINMNGQSINNITSLNNIQAGLVYLPQVDVTSSSNTPINIPIYNGVHQLLLRASPVPVIDTLVQQAQFIGSGSVICSASGNGFQWLGTSSGEIYCYDSSIGNWTLTTQFNGQINALHYCVASDRLYIGGSFNSCTTPFSGFTYNNVADISAPSTAQIIPNNLIWSGNSNGGLNGAVNAITEDGVLTIYFGGSFSQNADTTQVLNYFGCYNQSTNVLTPIDSNSSNGFDSPVYNLNYLSGTVCATGHFSTITTGGTPNYSPYCVTFAILGDVAGSVFVFDGAYSVLTVPIGGSYYDLIDNDGTDFIVAIQEVYASNLGNVNYLIKVATNGTAMPLGSNAVASTITSFYRKTSTGLTHALDSINSYYIDNALATGMLAGYFVFNFNLSDTTYFNLQGTGTQWAFVGSSANTFLFGGGRILYWYNGSIFTTGYSCQSPVIGSTLTLNWNGSYYTQICSLGSIWNPYT